MSVTTLHQPQNRVLVVWARGRRHFVGIVHTPDDGPARVIDPIDIFKDALESVVMAHACERARACGLPLYQRVGNAAYPVVIEQ